PVNAALEIARLREERRGNEVEHPTADAHAARNAFSPRGYRGFARISGKGVFVNITDVSDVEQVVDYELIVALDMDIPGRGGPERVVEPGQIRNFGWVGFFRITHPDRERCPFFQARVWGGLCIWRPLLLPGSFDTLPRRVELQAMVSANQVVAANLASRQRSSAMATAIF